MRKLDPGELGVAVGKRAEYAQMADSVTSGEIDAEPFGESHALINIMRS
jgi:hypothetical protein